MIEYGDNEAQRVPESAAVAEQVLGLLLDVALEPEERRIFLAGATRLLGVSRVGVQGYVEARYGSDEWRRTESYLSEQPSGEPVSAVGAVTIMAGDDEGSEEAN